MRCGLGITAIIGGITADTGLRLSRVFGLSEAFWIGLQTDYDTAMTKDAIEPELAAIEPWAMAA